MIAVKGKGKIIRVPIKNLYGARMGNGHWEWISGDKMRSAHCTDPKTEGPLPSEKGVNYCSFDLG